jgi:hypothetical protein
MSGRILPDNKTKKTKKTSTGCQKGARLLFLCLRATGETKKAGDSLSAFTTWIYWDLSKSVAI